MTPGEVVLFIVALVIMIIGLAGVILPILPGIPLIFAAAALYGIFTGFRDVTVRVILILAGLNVLGIVVDYLANYLSVRKMGGSRVGAIGAVIGLMIGIWIGVVWVVVLPFLLSVAFELLAGKEGRRALKAGTGALVGLLFSGLLRFVIGCVMIGLFVWAVLL
jgi:uncharacterized protein YqgC (DUF456 family)